MSNSKVATKRKAEKEKDIEYLREKLRKALEDRDAARSSVHTVYYAGEYRNQGSSPSVDSDSESEDHPLFRVDKNAVSSKPASPIEARRERGPAPQTSRVAREKNNSMSKQRTNQGAQEVVSSMTDLETIKASHPDIVALTPPQALQESRHRIHKDEVHMTRYEIGYIAQSTPRGRSNPEPHANVSPSDKDDETQRTMNKSSTIRNQSRTRKPSETFQANSPTNSSMDQSTELLNVFSSDFSLSGEDIHSILVEEWNPILKKGLPENVKETILKKYATPDNCRLLRTPTLNEEVSAVLDEHARYRDKNLQLKQDQMGIGLTAMAKGITALIERRSDKNCEAEAMRHFRQGCLLLADIHFDQTKVRRFLSVNGNQNMHKFIFEKFCKDIPVRNPKHMSSLDVAFDRDDTLFGLKAGKVFKKFTNPQIDVRHQSEPRFRRN